MDTQTGPLAPHRDELIAQIMVADRSIERLHLAVVLDTLMAMPLTVRQLKLLGVIAAGNGTVNSQQLAQVFRVSLATVSGLVDRLVERGMVTRVANEIDHRIINLTATDAGARVLHDLVVSSSRLRQRAVRSLAPEDLSALAQGLGALAAALSTQSDPNGGQPQAE